MQVVNVRYKIVTPNDEHLLSMARKDTSNFMYKYIPILAYNKKSSDLKDLSASKLFAYNNLKPFALYEFGLPISLLKSFSGNRISNEDLISVKSAFLQLKNIASQCYERVVADLCCDLILEEIKKNTDESELFFFIEKSMSDKMLGRLGSLFLDLSNITITFITMRPSDLMTAVMSYQTGKITFDLQRLLSDENTEFYGPYPGNSEESLIQTYFYKPGATDGKGSYRPMRLDIFAQGLLIDEIDKKRKKLQNLLVPYTVNTEHDKSSSEPRILLPYGYADLEDFLKKITKDLHRRIYYDMGASYD